MKNQALTFSESKIHLQGWKKHLLLLFLQKLHFGYLKLIEGTEVIGFYGDPKSTLSAIIEVKNHRFYHDFLFGGSIGAGESYIRGDWDSPDLTSAIQIFLRNEEMLDEIERKYTWLTRPANKFLHLSRKNTKTQAKENISAHYDLGNDLYQSFLDTKMMYSSAIFSSANTSLEDAQTHKLQSICEKLQLRPTDHVVEIGTGWGGLAIYMAKNYGCNVTTTTISQKQYEYASQEILRLGLNDKIQLLQKDYRDLDGQYDKLVSVEMIEAVGQKYMPSFFQKCQKLLKPEGLMLLQSITLSDQRMSRYEKNVDFIQKHIFPGGFLPSIQMITKMVAENTQISVRDIHDIGIDYALTLNHWFRRFDQSYPSLKEKGYDQRFYRLWKFYLQCCEAGFLERSCSAVQILLSGRRYLESVSRV